MLKLKFRISSPKKWILAPKNLSNLRSKSIKIDLKIHIENYLTFSSKNEAAAKFSPRRRVGGVHPTSKDGSALDYPSISKILGLLTVWSSNLCVCSMFLNSQTLGCSWETLLGFGFTPNSWGGVCVCLGFSVRFF